MRFINTTEVTMIYSQRIALFLACGILACRSIYSVPSAASDAASVRPPIEDRIECRRYFEKSEAGDDERSLACDKWSPDLTATAGAPAVRAYTTSVWTGTNMIIFGGSA